MRVVHRDAHVIVVDKPSGLLTTSTDERDCLAAQVRRFDPDAPRCHATSRLDYDVSGMVTFSRTQSATVALERARETGAYSRWYLALIVGDVEGAGEWDASIGVDPQHRSRRRVGGRNAKIARTEWRVLANAGGVALLSLRPRTGRTHQLRVHASAAGLPIVGDRAYKGTRRITLGDGRVLSADRTMLHCTALELPSGDQSLRLRCDPPEDFAELWIAAGGHQEAFDLVKHP